MNFIIKRSGLDQREFNKLFLLILHSFFSAIFVSVFFSVANAEFVANFGSHFLPIGYLLSGIVGYLTVRGYGRLLKIGGYRAFVGGLFFLLICTILFRFILFFTAQESTRWMSFVIFLFAMPFLSISGLEQSGLLLKIYDIREGKKYAGIINSGATVASIIGYLSIPILIPFLGSRFDLFYIAIVGMSVSLYFLYRINQSFALEDQKPSSKPGVEKPADISLRNLLKQKYIRYITISGGISMVAFYFVDYSFLINAKSSANSAAELTAIIGAFFGFIKTAELILSLFSGKIFRTFGLKVGMIVLPAVCVSLTILGIVIHSFSNAATFVALIFCLKFFERIVSKAIEEPTYKNLYQLLNPADRLAIQAKIDGGTRQLFIIAGSLILLLYGSFMPPKFLKIGMLYISLPIFLFWLFSSRQLLISFKEKLRDLLKSGVPNRNAEQVPLQRLGTFLKHKPGFEDPKTKLWVLIGHQPEYILAAQAELKKTKIAKNYNGFVPSPIFNDLVSDSGNSRLEVRLDNSLFVIPAGLIPTLSSSKRIGTFEESDLLDLAFSGSTSSNTTISSVGKKLEIAKNPHEKKLVIDVLIGSKDPEAITILLQHLDYPDYQLKKLVFDALEMKNYKYTVEQEIVYRTSLENTLSELTYIVSVISAVPMHTDNTDLLEALTEEENILKNRLLSILTWKYDKTSIMVIRENIFPGDKSQYVNNILALELIDNLVDREIKDRIMPVFESGSYASRHSTLSAWYHFPPLEADEVLVNVLHHDYTKIGIWVKACALKIILEQNKSEHKKEILGFIFHPHPLLKDLSTEFVAKMQDIKTSPSSGSPRSTHLSKRLTGEEIYSLVKSMKHNRFLSKVATNDLLTFSLQFETRRSASLISLQDGQRNENIIQFILAGFLILEFKKNIPNSWYQDQVISSDMFGEDKLSKVLLTKDSKSYQVSAEHLLELMICSDQLMNNMISHKLHQWPQVDSAQLEISAYP